MIRTLLMALGAYTLYRMYVPLESEQTKLLESRPGGATAQTSSARQQGSGGRPKP